MKMRLQVVNVNPPTAAPTTVTPTPPAAGAPGPADSGAFAGQSATALLVGAMAAVFVDLMS
ncbi:hypothetical protein Mapa_005240 [Marchantia paleacea]|nr:hypothetical protein Mapa_005240 [Marchantia paleacea]